MVPALALLFLAGFSALLLITAKWGIGITPDSVGYILAAETLFRGQGMLDIPRFAGDVMPFTRHGPVFSLMIWAGMFLTGGHAEPAARGIQALLFGANAALAGGMTYHYSRSRMTALAAAWLMLTSLVMLEIHAQALSEPVFILMGMLGFYALSLYFETDTGKTRYFWLALACFAVSILSRYAGVSVAGTAGLTVLVFGRGHFAKRFLTAVLAGGLSLLPMVCWVLRNYKKSQTLGFPSLKCEPYFLTNLWELGANTSIWILPASTDPALRGMVLAAALVLGTLAVLFVFGQDRRPRSEGVLYRPARLPWVLFIFIFCHLAVHFLSSIFIDPDELSNRHLAPVYAALLVCVCLVMHRVWRELPLPHLRRTIPLFTVLFILSSTARAAGWAYSAYEKGLGYASPLWSRSPLLEKIRQLPENVPIYTNGLDIVYWFTRRPVQGIPDKLPQKDAAGQTVLNPELLKSMAADMHRNKAVLAYFDTIYWRYYYYPTLKELQAALPLEKTASAADGGLYRLAASE